MVIYGGTKVTTTAKGFQLLTGSRDVSIARKLRHRTMAANSPASFVWFSIRVEHRPSLTLRCTCHGWGVGSQEVRVKTRFQLF